MDGQEMGGTMEKACEERVVWRSQRFGVLCCDVIWCDAKTTVMRRDAMSCDVLCWVVVCGVMWWCVMRCDEMWCSWMFCSVISSYAKRGDVCCAVLCCGFWCPFPARMYFFLHLRKWHTRFVVRSTGSKDSFKMSRKASMWCMQAEPSMFEVKIWMWSPVM